MGQEQKTQPVFLGWTAVKQTHLSGGRSVARAAYKFPLAALG